MASLPPQVVIQERPKKHYFPKEFENWQSWLEIVEYDFHHPFIAWPMYREHFGW
jgi:hypothetical protein